MTEYPDIIRLGKSTRPSGSYHSQVTSCKRIHQFVGACGCKFGTVGYEEEKYASLRVQRYTLSNEFRNFKTACGTRVGASVCEYGTSLRDSLVRAWADAFNESIEGLWPGRLRSRGSCLHSHRRGDGRDTYVSATV